MNETFDLVNFIAESIYDANYHQLKNTKSDIDIHSRESNEAMAIVFSEILTSEAFSEYFSLSVSNISMEVDEYGAFITKALEDNSGTHKFFPSKGKYEEDISYYVDNTDSIREMGKFNKIEDDYEFSESSISIAQSIKEELVKNEFFKEIFYWDGLDALLDKGQDVIYHGDIKDIGNSLMPNIVCDENPDKNNTIEMIAKNSGLDFFDLSKSRFDNQNVLFSGVVTPMGVASYAIFREYNHDSLGDIKALSSIGTAIPFEGAGLAKKVTEKAVNKLQEEKSIVMRTTPGSNTPMEFTKSMDDMFYKANKEGKSAFLQGNFMYCRIDKIDVVDNSDDKVVDSLRQLSMKTHEVSLDTKRDNAFSTDNISDAIELMKKEDSKSRKRSNASFSP